MRALLGPSLVLIFTLSQAFRDVDLGEVFQRYNYFVIILLAFSLSTAIFACATFPRAARLRQIARTMGAVIASNITTALAWTCFFFALTYLDPAIVNTIHSAMGPLTVVALGSAGVALAKPKPLGRVECAGYVGIAASVAALRWVVIGGYSGLPASTLKVSVMGLGLLSVSGTSITVSLLYCKRLQDHGIGADAVTAARYIVLIALAAAVVLWRGKTGIATPQNLPFLHSRQLRSSSCRCLRFSSELAALRR